MLNLDNFFQNYEIASIKEVKNKKYVITNEMLKKATS